MNRSGEIIDYLSKATDFERVIIAPNAPPVTRRDGEIAVALTRVLDASDVADTLVALRERAGAGETVLNNVGHFSFGIREVGRFRVHYVTQRGSRVISITRIPFASRDVAQACTNPQAAAAILQQIQSGHGGVVTISGASLLGNSLFAYALLRAVNAAERHILYVVERELTFLMAHENSIVIQSELQADADTFAQAIGGGMRFSPDVLYVGDVGTEDEAAAAACAFRAGMFTIVSSSTLQADRLAKAFRLETLHPRLEAKKIFRASVLVQLNPDRRVTIDFEDLTG